MTTPPSQGQPGTPASGNETIVTHSVVVVPLDPSQQQQAKDCLQKSGKITIRFKEVEVTQLPGTISESAAIAID